MQSPWELDGPLGTGLSFRFLVVKLWEQSLEDWLASGQTSLLIFTALLKDASLASVDEAIETISQVPDPVERANALNYLILFAMRKFGAAIIADHIRGNEMLDNYIAQSEWYQIILERGEQRGKQNMAQRALEGRFGTVDADILAALAQADESTLEAIVLHITTDTIEQVRERLGLA